MLETNITPAIGATDAVAVVHVSSQLLRHMLPRLADSRHPPLPFVALPYLCHTCCGAVGCGRVLGGNGYTNNLWLRLYGSASCGSASTVSHLLWGVARYLGATATPTVTVFCHTC
jgi:hypothetical protein